MTSPGVQPSSEVNGYETVHTAGSRFGQDLTESSIRSLLSVRTVSPFERFANNFVKGIADAIRGIASLGSLFAPIKDAAQEFRDGQESLKNRQDLIDQLLNYGSCYVPEPMNNESGVWFKMPFTRQIGAMRGVQIMPGGGLKFLSRGLWDIRSQIVSSQARGLLERFIDWEVRVYAPNGSLFSKQIGKFWGRSPGHSTIISSVMVPEAGYYVEVWAMVTNFFGTNLSYGPAYTRLTAQQINSDTLIGDTGSEASGAGEGFEG